MNGPRALALFAVALALVGVFTSAGSWAPPAGPPLVLVSRIAPEDVEPGDRITVTGDGFPAGKEARVRFRGTLHRPGVRPVGDAEIDLTGVVSGPDQVEIAFNELTQALFCGAGDRAMHTTFEGEVEVAFAAAAPGVAPVAGVLRHAVLDVRPSTSPADRARRADGARALAFLGLRVAAPTRRGLGLAVEDVQPGSPADQAGLAPGDAIMAFDGVRVTDVSDLVPPPGERRATLGVREAATRTDSERSVAVDGFRRAPPAEVLDAAIAIAAALVILLLAGASAPPALATALQRASARLRSRGGDGAIARSALRAVLPPAGPPAIADAVALGLLAVMPFGQYLVAARLDVAILFFAGTTLLAAVAVVAGGSAWRGVRAAAHVAWQHLPGAVAVASVILATGSLRVQEIARAQGGWPWDWLAFRSPAALVSLVLLLACARISPILGRAEAHPLAVLVDEPSALPAAPRGWVAAALRAHRLVVAGLAVTLFLGGWSLPGLSPAQQEGRLVLELAGAVWLVSKTFGLVLALAVLDRSLPARGAGEGTRAAARRGLPLAVAALVVTALWQRYSPEGPAQLLVSAGLLAATALLGVTVFQRLRHGLLASGADGHLSPFL